MKITILLSGALVAIDKDWFSYNFVEFVNYIPIRGVGHITPITYGLSLLRFESLHVITILLFCFFQLQEDIIL